MPPASLAYTSLQTSNKCPPLHAPLSSRRVHFHTAHLLHIEMRCRPTCTATYAPTVSPLHCPSHRMAVSHSTHSPKHNIILCLLIILLYYVLFIIHVRAQGTIQQFLLHCTVQPGQAARLTRLIAILLDAERDLGVVELNCSHTNAGAARAACASKGTWHFTANFLGGAAACVACSCGSQHCAEQRCHRTAVVRSNHAQAHCLEGRSLTAGHPTRPNPQPAV